jgi:hypothetical protein
VQGGGGMGGVHRGDYPTTRIHVLHLFTQIIGI